MKIQITKDNGETVTIKEENLCEGVKKLLIDCSSLKCNQSKKRWRAEKGGIYWLIGAGGEAYDTREFFDEYDNYRYLSGNYYQTKQEAEKAKEQKLAIQRVKDYIIENGYYNKGEYSVIATYHDIELCNFSKTIIFDTICAKTGLIDGLTSDNAQKVIDNCSKDLKIIFNI